MSIARAALRIGACLLSGVLCRPSGAQAVPQRVELAPPVRAALQSAAIGDRERAALRLAHGTWDDGDLRDDADRAEAALRLWRLDDAAFRAPGAPAVLRAEALVRAGKADAALGELAKPSRAREHLVRAWALEAAGRRDDAVRDARQARTLGERPDADRADRLDAVEATELLARLEGAPARDWQGMLDALARLREEDQLDPRPRLLEGRLLVSKDRFEDGVAALREALGRDVRSGEALYLLGRVAVQTFDFDGARLAASHLRALAPAHPLADLLDAEAALQSRDPDAAVAVLDAFLARLPESRAGIALRAASAGARFDSEGAAGLLARLDGLMPGSPLGAYELGRFLALGRQYEEAAAALGEASARAPGWSAPVAELGMLEMQSGRDAEAAAALRRAVELDPFDERARHSLTLVDMLSGWKRFEGEHFVVRCRPGIDEALAAWMPSALDAMLPEVTGWLGHVPSRKTVIELHPDHKSFAVRITGMPWIHTVAASTGPLIALEAPREGAPQLHLGTYDWLQVLRHEFVHTVTLDQTRNRIPHWFTEALATRLETRPRSWETVQLLAQAFDGGTLFGLDDINWAFVRPKRKTDRAQAYAQGAWMVEFIERAWGRDAIRALLARYRDGIAEEAAFREVLGVDRAEFMKRFAAHAEKDVRSWGMLPEPSLAMLVEEVRAELGAGPGPVEISDDRLDRLLLKHPRHPDLLEMWLRRRLRDGASPGAPEVARLEEYSAARPSDPWPHRVLAKAALAAGDRRAAVPHLRALDEASDNDPNFAMELARIERASGNPGEALARATKAARINAYDPATREFAAALAVEAGDLPAARRHIEALVALEPAVRRHRERLSRIEEMIATATRPPA